MVVVVAVGGFFGPKRSSREQTVSCADFTKAKVRKEARLWLS